MDENAYLEDLAGRPLPRRVLGYMRLTGPGYVQSALTLGGGSVASCVVLGALLGYRLLWVQPLGMFLGYFVLAAIAKQTCWSGERPYLTFWNRLHPTLAILWAIGALVATMIWHVPQYSIAADGLRELAAEINVDLRNPVGSALAGALLLAAACAVVRMYHVGADGVRHFETAVKILVWTVVGAFGIVVLTTGVQWNRLLLGITGIAFVQDLLNGTGPPTEAWKPIVGGLSAVTGINMFFLYPYMLLDRGWGKKHKELAYFDLIMGLALPFLLATTLMVLAVANTLGPAEGQTGVILKDIRAIVPVLAPTFGDVLGGEENGRAFAVLLIGVGMVAVGFSTIITHMLSVGFIACELFGLGKSSKAKWWFSVMPGVGVVGVFIKFPLLAAITASTLTAPLMPLIILCFLVLLFKKSYMGEDRPKLVIGTCWTAALLALVAVMTVSGCWSIRKNSADLQAEMARWREDETPSAAVDEPVETEAPEAQVEPEAQEEPEPQPGPIAGTFTHAAMGTEFSFTLYSRPGDDGTSAIAQIADEAFAAIDALESRLSSWIPTSQTSYLNNRAAHESVRVAPDIRDLLVYVKEVHTETQGAFDVTVGPLIEAWGFYKGEGRLPTDDELEDILSLVGMDKVEVDAKGRTVRFAAEGVRLDFGGIGKGLALDHAAEVLGGYGVTSAVLHAGTSTVLAIGTPPNESGWTVRVRDPYNNDRYIDQVILKDESLSTSGSYERFFELDGKKYCHIFDPRTGEPVEGILSATVVAKTGTESDALSTALFVLGVEGAREYCQAHAETRVIMAPASEDGEPQGIRINFPDQ